MITSTFHDLVAAVRVAQIPHFANPNDDAALAALEDRLREAWDAAYGILSQPAYTVAALQLKADAFAWSIDGEPQDGFEIDAVRAAALRSLLADVALLRA
ncbi:hypothetical protein ORIO_00495 [Cereibacter azotoformans]|uniref:Uncharacterized protein n=1 Tax=Cereibacter sphaeroides (strain ATCC 17025 / ATH 2.4.3) TaxID=349102 RepID=A4WNP3_CERS5|nr:hypothetical protein [Cereibacter azotoformans]ULB08420.1 hypothetical protein ORIO_00495 [Cereibacter azotoformans]